MYKNRLFILFVITIMPFTVLPEEIFGESDDEVIRFVSNSKYPIEAHRVETEDGYILTIFRIPHGRITNKTNESPVILNHGLFGSAAHFVWLGPKKSLAFFLADNGYDVWLMNCRGTFPSKNHKTYTPDTKQFWNFSWHEIGVYDIPAVIDYILNITSKRRLYYVGYSQGSTSGLVMGSERPEYNAKIERMIAIAPGAIYKDVKVPVVRLVGKNCELLQLLSELLHIYEIPPPFFSDKNIREAGKNICAVFKNTCTALFLAATRVNSQILDMNSLPSIFPIMLSSCSLKQIFHYIQLIKSGYFQQYDFGSDMNMERYGNRNPPLYNLKNITYPVAIIFSEDDEFIREQDVHLLAQEIPNVIAKYKIPFKPFGHNDFILAKNLKKLMFNRILRIIRRY